MSREEVTPVMVVKAQFGFPKEQTPSAVVVGVLSELAPQEEGAKPNPATRGTPTSSYLCC